MHQQTFWKIIKSNFHEKNVFGKELTKKILTKKNKLKFSSKKDKSEFLFLFIFSLCPIILYKIVLLYYIRCIYFWPLRNLFVFCNRLQSVVIKKILLKAVSVHLWKKVILGKKKTFFVRFLFKEIVNFLHNHCTLIV